MQFYELRRSQGLGGGEFLSRALQGHRPVRKPRVRRRARRCWKPSAGRGAQLYIATSKPWVFAREIARHFDFAQHFKVIYGSELDGTRTNKVELIRPPDGRRRAWTRRSTLMIGDRKHDLIGARSNGLDAAAVGYGFGSRGRAEAPKRRRITFETLDEMHQAFLQR